MGEKEPAQRLGEKPISAVSYRCSNIAYKKFGNVEVQFVNICSKNPSNKIGYLTKGAFIVASLYFENLVGLQGDPGLESSCSIITLLKES